MISGVFERTCGYNRLFCKLEDGSIRGCRIADQFDMAIVHQYVGLGVVGIAMRIKQRVAGGRRINPGTQIGATGAGKDRAGGGGTDGVERDHRDMHAKTCFAGTA